jgi:hypothetical protein
MSQTNEILDLSQWLHDKGFEPDMWWTGHSFHESLESTLLPSDIQAFYWGKRLQPYFTLNRALELLPNVIRADGFKYEFEMYKTADGFIIWYTSDCGAVNKDFEGESSTSDEVDVELAALRLLKQVVEKGYLSNNSNSSKGGAG